MPKLEPRERIGIPSEPTITSTSTAPRDLPDEYLSLAHMLAEIHGNVRYAREEGGLHFYMASPICLEQDGLIELKKMHLAVNAQLFVEQERDNIGMCMKTGKTYLLSHLLRMPNLQSRGIELHNPKVQHSEVNVNYLEPNAQGVMVPKSPGEVVPVKELPMDHPAQVFLQVRQYDASLLWDQFRLSYGLSERTDMFYKRLPGGFSATPQGRVIFFMDVNGIQVGWQARILEIESDGYTYYFHPYKDQWIPVKHEGRLLPGFENWDPVKYLTSHGARRNQSLLGLDAAVAAQKKDKQGRLYCFLVEGPLDAGRLFIPGIAHIGRYVSPSQAEMIANHFQRVIYIRDNDAAGLQAVASAANAFAPFLDRLAIDFIDLPPQFKDVGTLSPAEAEAFKSTLL